jgi:hypothetical protein
MKSLIFARDNSAPANGSTTYNRINAITPSSWTANESLRLTIVAHPFTLSSFYMQFDTAPGVGNAVIYTIMKNGSATAVTVTIADAAISATDAVNSVSFAAGDTISIRATTTGTPVSIGVQYWNMLIASSDGSIPMLSGLNTPPDNTGTYYGSLTAGHSSSTGWSATEADMQIVVPTSGVISGLRSRMSTAPGSVNGWTHTLMKNGSATTVTTTISGTNTVATDSTHTFTVAAGDTLTIRNAPVGTPVLSTPCFSMIFTPDNYGESFFGYGTTAAPSTTTTQYEEPLGVGQSVWTNNESNRVMVIGPCTLTKFAVKLGAAPGGVTTRTFTLRKVGATTALSTVVSGAATTGSASGTVTYTQGQTFAAEAAVSGGPAAMTGGLHLGYVMYFAPDPFLPQIIAY